MTLSLKEIEELERLIDAAEDDAPCKIEVGYLLVENPAFAPDNGAAPYLGVDLFALLAAAKRCAEMEAERDRHLAELAARRSWDGQWNSDYAIERKARHAAEARCAEMEAALERAVAAEREACAQIGDIYADTKPVNERSTNPTAAAVIATVMSDTGRKIAAAIRAREVIERKPHD